jgi:serine/threonine-protein kinase
VRLEAAAYRGRPVYFEIVTPWHPAAQQSSVQPRAAGLVEALLLRGTFFGALIFGSLLAWKNLRLGRGDRKGAFRLALFIFGLQMVNWIFYTHHVPTADEAALLLSGLQLAVFEGCVVGLMYLALEPFLRRRWPDRIISWSRLLAGSWRDPMVGRDVLIGAAFGGGLAVLFGLQEILPSFLGGSSSVVPFTSPLLYRFGLLGPHAFMPLMLASIRSSVLFGFVVVFIILFFVLLLRRNWLGIGVAWLLFAGFFFLRSMDFGISGALTVLLVPTLIVLVVVRFGPLAFIILMFVQHLRAFFPITTELSAWYAISFILYALAILLLTAYAFYTSLGGQPLLRGRLLDET